MRAIVAVDDGNGLMFNNRRQSRDRVMISDLCELTSDSKLYIYDYSKELFDLDNNEKIIVMNDGDVIEEDSYVFFEDGRVNNYKDELSQVVIYHWNRAYPGDVFFDIKLDDYKVVDTKDFVGSSHEKITRKIHEKDR